MLHLGSYGLGMCNKENTVTYLNTDTDTVFAMESLHDAKGTLKAAKKKIP